MDELEVLHDEGRHRYELVADGTVVGLAEYRPEGDADVVTHTQIDPSRRGQGLGAVLVEGVLADLRARGRRVVPQCWYVADHVRDRPEHHDLLA